MSNKTNELDVKEAATTALVTINPDTYVSAVYEPFAKSLATAIKAAKKVTYVITTKEGMAIAKEQRAIFRDIRIEGEKKRKEAKDPIIAIGRLLDSKYKEIESVVTPYEDKFDADIKAQETRLELEKAEKIRKEEEAKAAVQNRIDAIKNKPIELLNSSADDIDNAIAELSPIVPTIEDYGDRVVEAEYTIKGTIDALKTMADGKRAQAELAAQQAAALATQQAQLTEQSRIDGIKNKVQAIKNYIIDGSECETSTSLNVLIEKLDALVISEADFAEFTNDAKDAQAKALQVLHRQHAALFNAEEAEAAKQNTQSEDAPNKLDTGDGGSAPLNPAQETIQIADNGAPLIADHFAEVGNKVQKPLTTKSEIKHFYGTEPTVNEIVTGLAEKFGVDEMVAHRWLLNCNFLEYKKAA